MHSYYYEGQAIQYMYHGREYADKILYVSEHIPNRIYTKHHEHTIDASWITNTLDHVGRITPVARPRTAEQLIVQSPRQPTPDLRTAYEESLVSLVDAYELNRLHEQISEMHRAHAIDLALDANDAERFKQLTEGAWSS